MQCQLSRREACRRQLMHRCTRKQYRYRLQTAVRVYVYVDVYVYVYTYIHTCVCVYVYVHTYIHTCVYVYAYVHTHIHTRIKRIKYKASQRNHYFVVVSLVWLCTCLRRCAYAHQASKSQSKRKKTIDRYTQCIDRWISFDWIGCTSILNTYTIYQ